MPNSDIFSYTISFPKNDHQSLRVELKATSKNSTSRFFIANWVQGSYKIRDFAKYISDIQFEGETSLLPLSTSSWESTIPPDNHYQLSYSYLAQGLSIRGVYKDHSCGFVHFPALCIFPEEVLEENAQIELEIRLPDSWSADGALIEQHFGFPVAGTIRLRANYKELISSPMLLGRISSEILEVAQGFHPRVSFCPHLPLGNLAPEFFQDLTAIVQNIDTRLGSRSEQDYFVFLALNFAKQFGGLEHPHSTALLFDPAHIQKGCKRQDYIQVLGLFAHEYIHRWNVLDLKPSQFFADSRRQLPAYSNSLWWFEGMTSYLDDRLLYEAGLISLEEYLEILQKAINRHYQHQGRCKRNIKEASHQAWIGLYQADEQAYRIVGNYYLHGSLIGLWLDLQLQQRQSNLWDLLKSLVASSQASDGFVSDTGLLDLISEKIDKSCFSKLTGLLEDKADLLFEELVQSTKIDKHLLKSKKIDSQALEVAKKHGKLVVTRLKPLSQAFQSGIQIGDELLGYAGKRIESQQDLEQIVQVQGKKQAEVLVSRHQRIFKIKTCLYFEERSFEFEASKYLNQLEDV